MIRVLGPEVSIAEIVREAQSHGGEVSVVPAGETKAESIDLFAEVLDFPDWFGRNLDALADCLHDLAEEPREDGGLLHLVWDGVAHLPAHPPRGLPRHQWGAGRGQRRPRHVRGDGARPVTPATVIT